MSVLMNVTYNGLSGNYFTKLPAGINDHGIRRVVEEAVRAGEVPGLPQNIPGNAFADHVIDRVDDVNQARYIVRPKVPFG